MQLHTPSSSHVLLRVAAIPVRCDRTERNPPAMPSGAWISDPWVFVGLIESI